MALTWVNTTASVSHGRPISDMWSVTLRGLIAGAAMPLAFAPAAAGDPGEYLAQVQPFYTNFSAEQLLSEGMRACTALRSGMTAPSVVLMVQRDIGASVPAA